MRSKKIYTNLIKLFRDISFKKICNFDSILFFNNVYFIKYQN